MRATAAVLLLGLTACGYSSRGSELTGQVKKVVHNTPLICPDYVDADISLGVMRNGVGSMSSEDVWANVDNQEDVNKLEAAAKSGALVRVTFDVKRLLNGMVAICRDSQHFVTSVEVLP